MLNSNKSIVSSLVLAAAAVVMTGSHSQAAVSPYDTAVNALNPVAYYQFETAGSSDTTRASGTNAINPLNINAADTTAANLNNSVNAFGTASTFDSTHGYTGFGATNNVASFNGTTIASVLNNSDSTAGYTNASALRSKLGGVKQYTVSTWFVPGSTQVDTSTSAPPTLVSFLEGSNTSNTATASGFQLNYTTTGIRVGGRSATTDGFQSQSYTYGFTAGQLYNVVAVVDIANNDTSLYINGVAVTTKTGTISFANSGAAGAGLVFGTGSATDNSTNLAGEVSMGGLYNTFNSSETGLNAAGTASLAQLYVGQMDATSLYNRALTATEVAGLYTAAGVSVPEPASLALFGLAGAFALRRRAR